MRNLLVVLTLFCISCGPVVPDRIDVVVSGSVAVKPSLEDLTAFFQQECAKQYTDQVAIQDCVTRDVNSLLAFLQGLGK